MKLRTTVFAVLTAATLAGTSACVVEPARVRYVDVDVAPPPPRVVVTPAVRAGYVWAPGYWRWDGRRHVWVEGHYIRERRGYHWRPAHWEERGGRYHFEEGHWER
jgi:hypothetical protein